MLNKCCLCHFSYFVQSIKVTVSFESLFFVRSVFCVCVFVFVFSHLSLFYFQLSFLVFLTLCAFSSMGFTFFFLPFFFLFQPPFKRFKFSYTVPAWESSRLFGPLSVKRNSISWVHHDGKPLQPGIQSPQPRNSHPASDWVESFSSGDVSADVSIHPCHTAAILDMTYVF